jgi:glycosyltransferase involved in cell wall biosynthesis
MYGLFLQICLINILYMKVLHIYKCYYPFSVGGVEKYIYSLSESLSSYGVESAVLTTKKGSTVHIDRIGKSLVHYFPATFEAGSCPISPGLLRNFRRLARDFDILHYHFPWPFADLTNFMNSANKPVVVTYHSDIIRQKWMKIFYYPLMQLFLSRANAIIASSDNYARLSSTLKKYSEKVTVIPFGLDSTEYPQASKEIVQRWQGRVGNGFFLFVGTLRYYKGLDFLLQAVYETDIRVVIAGSGPEETRLLQLKQSKKMDNVTFVGQISEQDKAALYQLCRASVTPSHLRTEAFCISLLESLIYGKPAISTELNTGTSFVNRHQVSGLVIPPANPLAIRQAMQLLLTDETLYRQLTQGTQTHYQKYFRVELMRDKHIQLYRNLKTANKI